MSLTTAKQFLDQVTASGLLSAVDLATVTGQPGAPEGRTAQDLAKRLVEENHLTSLQAELLLTGEANACTFAKRYQLLEKLGAGGMGAVYKALDTKLDRHVAIKVMASQYVSDPDALTRFQREARALAKVHHPGIVQLFDSGEDEGRHFLVMEFVDGPSLQSLIKERGHVAPTLAADFVHQTARALHHAHDLGLVHRDVKPANLLVANLRQPPATVKVLDLGLARFVQDHVGDATLTREGAGMGTPDYASPEQIRNAHGADERSDVYSLGCTLYHLLAGQVPFPGTSLSEKMKAHEQREPTALEELCPEAPMGLVLATRRMMAKLPAERFQSMRDVAEALALT